MREEDRSSIGELDEGRDGSEQWQEDHERRDGHGDVERALERCSPDRGVLQKFIGIGQRRHRERHRLDRGRITGERELAGGGVAHRDGDGRLLRGGGDGIGRTGRLRREQVGCCGLHLHLSSTARTSKEPSVTTGRCSATL